MRLELVNFRCWKKRTFEFPDEGLFLLSGASGAGKSSILSSIYFVLYGTGTKIISFGEKKCLVRFCYNGFDITRTKGPNRLLLSVKSREEICEYEDEVAQEIITKKFGKNFTITSYITQKTVQSFLNLSPNDKMNFLEGLSSGEEDISGIKKKAKEKIKEKKEALVQKVGQLELLTLEVGDMKPPEEIPFPLCKKHSDVKIKNEAVYWKRTIKELEEKRDIQKKVEGEYSKEKINKALKEKSIISLSEIEEKRASLVSEISEIHFDGDDTLNDLKSTLNFLKNKREFSMISDRYNEEKKRYDLLYSQEINTLKEEESLLRKKIEDTDKHSFNEASLKVIEDDIIMIEERDRIDKELCTHKKNRSDYKEYDRETRVKELEEGVELLQKETSSIEQRFDIKCCPNCKKSLRFNKTILVLADGEPVDEAKSKDEVKRIKTEITKNKTLIDSIKREINTISYTDTKIEEYKNKMESKRIPLKSIDVLKSDLKILKEKKREFKDFSDKLKLLTDKINTEDLSPTLKKLKVQVEKRKKELESVKASLDEEFETDYTEEELREEISKGELLSQKLKYLNKQLSECVSLFEKKTVELREIKISDRDFEEEITILSDAIVDLIKKEKHHKETDEKIKKYLQYKKQEEEYQKWVDKLNKCKDEEESAKKELSYCDIFLTKIREAESLAISQSIETINYYMNYYLEKFFPSDPITLEITPYKETKKDIKPSINIIVGYKGVDTDINSLSGGEYDRVNLSIVLALNSIFGSSLLMLDESISSLDSELTNEILEVLKETMKGKLVVVVAHQISVGVFDSVLNVEE